MAACGGPSRVVPTIYQGLGFPWQILHDRAIRLRRALQTFYEERTPLIIIVFDRRFVVEGCGAGVALLPGRGWNRSSTEGLRVKRGSERTVHRGERS
jgi:hypothetical protein